MPVPVVHVVGVPLVRYGYVAAFRSVLVRMALMLRVLGLFDKFMREAVEMNYLMTEPVIMDDSALRSLIGTIRKTPYAEGIRRTLAAVPQPAQRLATVA